MEAIENGNDLPIEYVEGNDVDFAVYVRKNREKMRWVTIDGHARWLMKLEDGTECILRPISAKP